MESPSDNFRVPDLEPECRFCYPPEPWRIIYSATHFNVQMGLGPLAEGYALILSRSHYSCCAGIPDQLAKEFDILTQLVAKAQISIYGASLIFEHGRSGACLPPGHGEDLCYHAHLHFLPVSVDLSAVVENAFATMTLPSWNAVRKQYADAAIPYLLVQRDDQLIYAEVPQKIPRRYLRTALARELGEPEFEDWMVFPRYDMISAGLDKLKPTLINIINTESEQEPWNSS